MHLTTPTFSKYSDSLTRLIAAGAAYGAFWLVSILTMSDITRLLDVMTLPSSLIFLSAIAGAWIVRLPLLILACCAIGGLNLIYMNAHLAYSGLLQSEAMMLDGTNLAKVLCVLVGTLGAVMVALPVNAGVYFVLQKYVKKAG